MFTIILPSCYFPPISYFLAISRAEQLYIESHENYIKQTYRNRCDILGANGILSLIIPIQHTGKRVMKDIEIAYDYNWQNQHLKSLKSAYQRSPYFEYYEEDILKIYEDSPKFLLDWNLTSLEICKKILKWDFEYFATSSYQVYEQGEDLRALFSPKKPLNTELSTYHQVFEDRFEFQKNLSILDLICNLGPESYTYLNRNNLIEQ